ncbi:hypothetical protein WJX72_006900 [[Myrmecia] bisecta]|uniref:Uncharacterized protein n=1 Tax=[Myrmecia] bisecta TaxID=41462 RepID=A0AAW1PAG3_9CHLO
MSWQESGKQHFTVFNRLISRAVAACLPSSALQETQRVVTRVKRVEQTLIVTVSDTGRHIPADLKVVKYAFQCMFDQGADCLADGAVTLRSTALDESFIRVYTLKPKRLAARGADAALVGVDVTALPCAPKASQEAFSGSEVSFTLVNLASEEAMADAVGCMQNVLDMTAMVAPRVVLELRLRGFGGPQQPPEQQGAVAAPEIPQHPLLTNGAICFDVEPMPEELSKEDRLCEGLRGWFDRPPEEHVFIDPNTGLPQQLPSLLQYVIAVAGVDGHADEPSPAQRTGQWTAQVALVMNSNTPSPTLGCVLPPGQVQLHIFRNFALPYQPTDNVIKAFKKCSWANFGLGLEAVTKQHDGSAVVQFSSQSDGLILELSAVVIHLYTSNVTVETETGKPPALSAQTEAKLIRTALEDALTQVKCLNPGRLASKQESRLQTALPYLARTLATTILASGRADLLQEACYLLGTNQAGLHRKLEHEMMEAAENEVEDRRNARNALPAPSQQPGVAQIAAMGMGV